EQNRSVAFGPIAFDTGTLREVSRQFSIATTACRHLDPALGPYGPLYSQLFSSPQRPSKSIQPNSLFGSGSSGSSTTSSGTIRAGVVVLSQPKPVPFSPQPM